MNEFDVKRRLAQRSEQVNNESAPQMTNGIPNSVLADVFAGKQKATSEMMGRRSNLAPSIAAKMSQSFGMDVSGVQIYRSDAMAGSDLHGMAQGNKVVLGSDVDLNTLEGQAALGHELSHIRAQSMGIGTGSGLLSDAGLEHQADAEGMLAARGMNISGESMGMSTGLGMAGLDGVSPIGTGLGATAAAPMQALFGSDKDGDDKNYQHGALEYLGYDSYAKGIDYEETDEDDFKPGDLENRTDEMVMSRKEMNPLKVAGAFLIAPFTMLGDKIGRKYHGAQDDIIQRGMIDTMMAGGHKHDNSLIKKISSKDADNFADENQEGGIDPDYAFDEEMDVYRRERYQYLKGLRDEGKLQYEDANEYNRLKEMFEE